MQIIRKRACARAGFVGNPSDGYHGKTISFTIREVRDKDVSLHLLGISRTEHYATFRALGVRSLDSTSPFRQAFKDLRFIMLGSGEVIYQMIYIDDLVDGILLCGTKSDALENIYILTGSEPTTLNYLVQLIAEVLDALRKRVKADATRWESLKERFSGLARELRPGPYTVVWSFVSAEDVQPRDPRADPGEDPQGRARVARVDHRFRFVQARGAVTLDLEYTCIFVEVHAGAEPLHGGRGRPHVLPNVDARRPRAPAPERREEDRAVRDGLVARDFDVSGERRGGPRSLPE
jgi:hypothetical protein